MSSGGAEDGVKGGQLLAGAGHNGFGGDEDYRSGGITDRRGRGYGQVTRPIMDLCLAAERRTGSRVANCWREQDIMDLEGTRITDQEA